MFSIGPEVVGGRRTEEEDTVITTCLWGKGTKVRMQKWTPVGLKMEGKYLETSRGQ